MYSPPNEIIYSFTLVFSNQLGSGRLKFHIGEGTLTINVDYRGWMERYSSFIFRQWIDGFCINF
ncbi:STK_08120 family protein [Metallosphaera sp.]|uniref:DUF3211 domain-containing protein n=1 Tax=Metallosphaera prunae TaxID=47304 RepID=A0A4D8RR22_METPR|nr:DUF3211 domain-containing protein [Metallosphaera prunae]